MKTKIKKAIKITTIVVLIITGYAMWQVLTPIHFDKPTGPYAVGTFGTEITDSSRIEDAMPKQHVYRRLILQFWYPAAKTDGLTKTKYHPDPDYFVHDVNALFPDIPAVFLKRLANATTNSLMNAPVSTKESNYPVIVYSHGMDGTRFLSTYQMEELEVMATS